MADKIIVLDFGSQYNQLIARRIREFGVYSELHPHTMTLEEILALKDVRGIIFSGGPNSVYDEEAFKCDPAIFESGIPVLGICYGMQMTHFMNGGSVKACEAKEYGRTEITIETDSPIFKGLPKKQIVWMSHGCYENQKLGIIRSLFAEETPERVIIFEIGRASCRERV